MSPPPDRFTGVTDDVTDSGSNGDLQADQGVEALLNAYAARLAERPGLASRVLASVPAPVPAPILLARRSNRYARLALAACITAAVVVGMLFERAGTRVEVASAPSIEAEPILVALLAGSDSAELDGHPLGAELRACDSDWTGVSSEVAGILAFAGGER